MAREIKRFDIFMVSITSPAGTEIRIPQPCVIISPDELNGSLNTVTVAPVRVGGRSAPFRFATIIKGKEGQVAVEQLRTINKDRLLEKCGTLGAEHGQKVCAILKDMFAF